MSLVYIRLFFYSLEEAEQNILTHSVPKGRDNEKVWQKTVICCTRA